MAEADGEREGTERQELTRFRAKLEKRVREDADRARRRAEAGLRSEAERFVDERLATQFEDRLVGFSERLDALMAARLDEAGRSLSERGTAAAEQFEKRLGAAAERATRSIVTEATAAISRSVDDTRSQLLDELEELIAKRVEAMSDDLDQRAAEADSGVGSERGAGDLAESLQRAARQAEKDLADHAVRLAAEAEKLHRQLEERIRSQALKRMRSEIERIKMEGERAKRPRRFAPETIMDEADSAEAGNTRALPEGG